MRWVDEAVVLSARPQGEGSLVVTLLTRERGRHAGLVRGARRGQGRGIFEPGTRVAAQWQARLAEHLGSLRCELLGGCAAGLLDDPRRLSCLAAAAATAEAVLPEREAAPAAFAGFVRLLEALSADRGWADDYVRWEFALLAELGFGLDLTRCSATGATADLAFVSPRSSQAVSRTAGLPYRDRLLPLPAFLLGAAAAPTVQDIGDGLRLTGFFLERHALAPLSRNLPPARRRFVDRMSQVATIS